MYYSTACWIQYEMPILGRFVGRFRLSIKMKQGVITMTREDALEIIQNEKLQNFNWFDDHKMKPNEVGISEKANKWIVYTSDERAYPITQKEFQTEGEALENFIKRLRALNKLQNL